MMLTLRVMTMLNIFNVWIMRVNPGKFYAQQSLNSIRYVGCWRLRCIKLGGDGVLEDIQMYVANL
jgi:hypothetical protein